MYAVINEIDKIDSAMDIGVWEIIVAIDIVSNVASNNEIILIINSRITLDL
jgi:hypothetical protein